jgi:Flp pilus assembly protein TadB
MTKHQKQSLLLAILAVICFVGVGFTVAHNALISGIFFVAAILIIGFGFMLKSKRRKNGTL